MKLHKHHSDGSLKSIGREKRRSMDSLRSINGESVSQRYSDYSLRSFNGDCVSIPIDQYEQLLKAQQVSEINKSSCSLATLPGCFFYFCCYSERFLSSSPLLKKPTLPNSNSICSVRTLSNQFFRSFKCFVSKK